MSIHISKNRIRATGSDANGLFIAISPTETLLEWQRTKHGGEEFQRMVNEAVEARSSWENLWRCPACEHVMTEEQSKGYRGCPTGMHHAQHVRHLPNKA